MKLESINKTKALTECAILVALAVVLSTLRLFRMPMGGSVTPFATLPIIVISLRRGAKWGISSALVFSLIQLLLGLENFGWLPRTAYFMIMCALLDYVLAYTLIGLAGPLARLFKQRELGITVGVLGTGIGRFLCSWLSGILLWGAWMPEDFTSLPLYSFVYNGSWAGPDVAIALIMCLVLAREPALGLWTGVKKAAD
jgi:thiamine transporter